MTGGRVLARHHQLVARLDGFLRRGELAGDARRHGRRGREAVVVEDDAAGVLPRDVPVREVALDGGDAARVLELAHVVVRLEPAALAELLLEAAQELRVQRLAAAALAEELALQRVDGIDVIARPGGVGRVGGRQVGVDPSDEAVDVAEDGLALLAGVLQRLGLLRDDRLRLGARLEALQARGQPDGAQSRSVDHRDARVVAGLLQQQAAVFGDDPARRLHAADVGVRVDVGDVVAISQEGHAGERDGLLGGRPVGVNAELLGLVVRVDVVRGDVIEERRQGVVERRLGRGLRPRHAVLARGQDVLGDDRAVLGERTRADPHQENRNNANGDQDTSHLEHLSSLVLSRRARPSARA